MKKARKTVIAITAVLAVAGIASAVIGTVIKKNISSAEYKDAATIGVSDVGNRYSVKMDTDNIFESGESLLSGRILHKYSFDWL